MKKILIICIAILFLSACSTTSYSSRIRKNKMNQEYVQHEHSLPASKDGLRIYENQWRAPKLPFFYALKTGQFKVW